MAQKGSRNRFAALAEPKAASKPSVNTEGPMTEMVFPCFPGIVGQLAGRNWQYIKTLCADYRKMFVQNISITYDGAFFRVHLSSYAPGTEFIVREFGQRVAMANLGIVAEPAGAIIGRGGWWLRKTEAEQDVVSTIYHEDGCFFVKFPWGVSTADRVVAMDDIRRKLMGRAQFMHKALSESASESTVSPDTDQHLEDFLHGLAPTPAEAHN